jgi:hypothetical protein
MTPETLSTGGAALWEGVTEMHDLDPAQQVMLLEACRAKDRLDRLHREPMTAELHNSTASLLKQLIAALRLPDEHGRRPQRRGSARGAYRPQAPQRRNV